MSDGLRPLDALRLLRDQRCTATPMLRLGIAMLILRADNVTGKTPGLSYSALASDMGASRRCAIKTIGDLLASRDDDGIPIALRREVGEKRSGNRRDRNTYLLSIKPGWPRAAYNDGDRAAPVHEVHQPIGERGAPSLVNDVHPVGDPRAQVSALFSAQVSAKRRARAGATPQTRGTRLPSDWEPTPDLLEWASKDLKLSHAHVLAEVPRFRDYWRGIAGQKGVKLDWPATFRNWLRPKDWQHGGKRPSVQRGGFDEWANGRSEVSQ